MKKTLLIVLASGFGLYASAQSLDIGLRGGIASTWLLNQNVSNAGVDEDYVSSISADYGLHLELNFLGGTGIELEFISEGYNQKYKGTFENPSLFLNESTTSTPAPILYVNNEMYTSETTLNEIKIPLLFHYEAAKGLSLEVGPEYAIISSAKYTANFTYPSGSLITQPASLSYTTTSDFASSNLVAVLGFGWNIKLASQLYLLADLRFEYGLSDLIGSDGHGQDLNKNIYPTASTSLYQEKPAAGYPYYTYASYYATHSLEGSLNIGIFYRIPMGSSGHSKM